jgi:signal transduction histidine kinase/ActR/RegA family two-component response regulator
LHQVKSLKQQLRLMRVAIGVFLLLLLGVVALSYVALQRLADSAYTMSAAAGQRALAQRAATAVLALQPGSAAAPAQRAEQRERLRAALDDLEATQHALIAGARVVDAHGHAATLVPVAQHELALAIHRSGREWKAALEPLVSESMPEDVLRAAARFVLAEEPRLSAELLSQEAAVEQQQRARVLQFEALQLGALATLMLLFGALAIGVVRSVRQQHKASQQAQRALAAARDQAEEASRAKSQFLARMSHELRTPLNAVLGLSQVLRSSPSAFGADERNHLQTIERAGRHLLALIDDTLDLSRIEGGEMRVERAPVNLLTAVIAARSALDPQAMQAGVSWRVAPLAPGAAPWVWGDTLRVRQVLLNLISNAIKYNRSGGSVAIAIERANGNGNGWCVRVSDDGAGMSAQQVAHLFEPYNRLGAERGPVSGTGIGLTISQRLAVLMGGSVVASSTPGHGSTFTLTLPALEETDSAHDEGPITDFGTLTPSERGQGARLLYVEDNEVNIVVFEACLARRPGVALRVVRDGAQALEAARREQFDLVVLDLNLPDIDGLNLLTELKRGGHVGAAALLTADALPATAQRARAAGFDAVWTKPMEPGALLAHIDRLLQDRLTLEPH